ncbi:hypothetical protein SCLCIDRAFT_112816 [Scleroderma citrinum Foug A]|uniref:Uncharacterized protein n=1 Tax=Scleroderma citrinum Foug A TaxID=1036808 RepID=A0A0C3EBW1_9AGAM|nr:hypothetical protein SCLCIDRAFT_112816 [Scleroderma citrinum Foug A]
MQTIDQCPGWKIIFLDVFCEYCSWIATVSATSPPLFQDLFMEALERRSVHQGFTLENQQVILPNKSISWTHSQNQEYVDAFKAAISGVPKFFNNRCFICSTELLSNIPSENHMGVLTNFTCPFPPNVVQYVWTGTGWDSHLAYPIFHLFEADQNGLEVKWFDNPFVKLYVRAATNPHSRGWFSVAMYSQRGDGTSFWRGVSQPNVDFAAWILSEFIVDLTADILGDHTWNKYTVMSARLKAVCTTHGLVKCFLNAVLGLSHACISIDDQVLARHGILQLLNP